MGINQGIMLSFTILLIMNSISTAFVPSFLTQTSMRGDHNMVQKMGMFDDIVDLFNPEPKMVEVEENKRLLTIEVNSMKTGGLRFAIGLFLMGFRGKPNPGTWKTKQADDGVIDMFHNSDTGSLAFSFQDDISINVDRWGPFPSKAYLKDENEVLHGFLDELESMLSNSDEEDEKDNCLLELRDKEALNKARKSLSPR